MKVELKALILCQVGVDKKPARHLELGFFSNIPLTPSKVKELEDIIAKHKDESPFYLNVTIESMDEQTPKSGAVGETKGGD